MYRRFLLPICLIIIGAALGIFFALKILSTNEKKKESASILLEKIRAVNKLITVEGDFSEVYAYEDYEHWDIPWFRKKALIRVDATVSVGYNLAAVRYEVDSVAGKISISNFPNAEILSMETDYHYYDLTEGSFNQFEPQDITKLQKRAKDLIIAKVDQTELKQKAAKQAFETIEIYKTLLEQSGWEVIIEKNAISSASE